MLCSQPGGSLHAANLGDSGFSVWRFRADLGLRDIVGESGGTELNGEPGPTECFYRSPSQTVAFNTPKQLGPGSDVSVRLLHMCSRVLMPR